MKKVIAIKGQDPMVDQFITNMQEVIDNSLERSKFLQKQMTKFMEEVQEKKKQLWVDLEEYLEKAKKMPIGYDPSQHCIEYDKENAILWGQDKESTKDEFKSFLKTILE